jgi:signal transduction histidine kinase
MPSRSLVQLVTRRVLAITLAYMAILTVIIYTQIDSTLLLLRDKTLTEHAHNLGSYIETDKGTLRLNMPQGEKKLYATAGRYYQYVIRNEAGQIVFESPVAYIDRFPSKWPDADKIESFEFVDIKNTRFVGKSIRYDFRGKSYLIQVARSKNAADELSNLVTTTFMHKLTVFGAPFLALLIAIIVFSIRQSLAPISRVSQQAQGISAASPDVRLEEGSLPDEIVPLVHAVNQALDRLEAGIAAQKEFTANAAHELRTPLAVLRSHLDLMADQDMASKLGGDVDSMSRLVTQLLDSVRLDSSAGLVMERMDLAAAVRAVCTAIWPLMVREGRELEVSGIDNPVWISGNYDSVYRSLRNVLENTLHHTPDKTPVSVSIVGTSVSVRDHGPGIAESDKGKVFDKFWRKNHGQGTGAGIGLSIVEKTMSLHGGHAHVENSPRGGAIFILTFPTEDPRACRVTSSS